MAKANTGLPSLPLARFASHITCLGQWMSRMLNCCKQTAKCSRVKVEYFSLYVHEALQKDWKLHHKWKLEWGARTQRLCILQPYYAFGNKGPLQYGSAQVMRNSPKCYRLHLIKAMLLLAWNYQDWGKDHYNIAQHVLQASTTACTIQVFWKQCITA